MDAGTSIVDHARSCALTMIIIRYLPKLTKSIPSSLAAIIVRQSAGHCAGYGQPNCWRPRFNSRWAADIPSPHGAV